jgi:A/G-specific adenine glycosylase
MLQQTTVTAVLPYFERWSAVFPDLRSLAKAPLRRVLREWQGLGYYQRARNLHRAAAVVLREHGGRVPDDEATLSTLPGFGPYTTAAVLSLAYGRPLPVIDANVRRVLMRVLGLEGPAGPRVDRTLLAFLAKVFPAAKPGDFNQALMELGALLCRSRNPQCLHCPVRFACRAAQEGTQEIIPRPRSLKLEEIEAVVAIIARDGRYLIQQRADKGLLAGLWEFPGGKVEPGESLTAALKREVREEVGVEVRILRRLATVPHAYTRFRVNLHPFVCALRDPVFEPGLRRRWVTLAAIGRYPLPSGSVRIVDILAGKR